MKGYWKVPNRQVYVAHRGHKLLAARLWLGYVAGNVARWLNP